MVMPWPWWCYQNKMQTETCFIVDQRVVTAAIETPKFPQSNSNASTIVLIC